MKFYFSKFFIITSTMFLIFSCEGPLEEKPEDFLTPNQFFQTQDEAEAGLFAVYDMLSAIYTTTDILFISDMAANTATTFQSGEAVGFNNVDVASQNNVISDIWSNHFDGINRANLVISKVSESSINENGRQRIVGEAKFLRALFYFNLVRIFGDVPLKALPTESLNNVTPKRDPVSDIYEQIISDLKDAEVTTITESSADPGQVTQSAAKSLLAKVYLTIGNFANASETALEVIESNEFALFKNFRDAFLVENEDGIEHIFSVQFNAGNGNGNSIHVFTQPPELEPFYREGRSFAVYTVDDQLKSAYSDGDLRKEATLFDSLKINDADTVVNFPETHFAKYNDEIFEINNIGNGSINFPVIRYSEVLLIHAEAENEVNPMSNEALNSLNKVRRRAFGHDPDSPSTDDFQPGSQQEFREMVWAERFRELALEGHQWFDLRRADRLETVLGIPSNRKVFPIPQRELDTNPNMDQNPGF